VNKLSNRLKAIVKFVDKKDSIVDVGCDHGYLSIYLVGNKLVKKVIASDINQNALNSAIYNIKKSNLDIETVLSDGIENINLKGINTLVISGMGTSTILHILSDSNKLKNINKLLLQSNNDHEILRRNLNNIGYYLEDETYTFEKGKWYVTCKFVKSDEKNSEDVIKYGLLNNDEYSDYLLNYEKNIVKRIPWKSFRAKIKSILKYNKLKRTISNRK
jgi:tRNA (adenine22-N1)-methyltransferase